MKNVLFIFLLFLVNKGFSQNTVKIKEVDQAFDLIFVNPDAAIVALNTLEQQTKNQNDSLYGIVLNHKGVYYAVKSEFKTAIFYFDAAKRNLKKNSETGLKSSKNKAIALKKQGKVTEAIALLKSTLIEAIDHKYYIIAAVIYGELGSCNQALEQYQEALDFLIKSIELLEKYASDDVKKIGSEKQKLANLYFKMNNSDYALSILNEIKPQFKEQNDFYTYYLIQITQANIYLHLLQPSKALQYLDEALLGIERFDNSELTLFAFDRKAKAHELLKRNQQAVLYYEKAIALGIKTNQPATVFSVVEFGNFLVALKDFNKLDLLLKQTSDQSFKKIFVLTTTENQKRYYTFLADYHKAKGEKMDQEKYTQLRDSVNKLLDGKFNRNIVRENQANYRVKLVEKEIVKTKNELLFEKNKTIIIGLTSIMLIALGALVFFKSKSKAKNLIVDLETLKQTNKKHQDNYATEKLINTERLAQIKQKEQELLLQTIEMVEAQIVEKNNGAGNATAKNKENETLYWQNVLHKFKEINTGFDGMLMGSYPQLTKGDREFCAFVKLNLSNKEIAQLLQISHKSVISKKYRIVKKLNLDQEVDFYQWLNAVAKA